MSYFCTGRDLLSIEPGAFLASGFPSQELITGTDGVINGTAFTSLTSDFTAGVQAGMVLCTYTTMPSEGRAYEIMSVNSATELVVSILRANKDAAAIAPPDGGPLNFIIRSFASQISRVSGVLSEKLRQMVEVAGVSSADFADSEQLRIATAYGVLAEVFTARAENNEPADANWIKASHYRNEFRRLRLQLRLAVDVDGDGLAEETRTLGSVSLKRI